MGAQLSRLFTAFVLRHWALLRSRAGKLSVFFLSYFAPDPPDPPDPPGPPRPPYFFILLLPRFRSFPLLPASGALTLHISVEGLLGRPDGAKRGRTGRCGR